MKPQFIDLRVSTIFLFALTGRTSTALNHLSSSVVSADRDLNLDATTFVVSSKIWKCRYKKHQVEIVPRNLLLSCYKGSAHGRQVDKKMKYQQKDDTLRKDA